ncbi:hypothetical protein B6I21_01485 [candidate division KSB1 bacterium 4572_119]|nr:MAG: hypothetical protein B6I21_01485 [candidate division KSB1 bacterium 4572_119]
MKKIKLALGIHNHQPVGNFDFVFEDAYQKSYLPFLEILERHPKIKLAQHFTGALFEWLLNRDPDFGKRLRKMVASGQIEMMSGGYYEPILVNIPDEDKLGQIEKLNKFVRENTGYDPKGLWLAERIWEPQLPKPLKNSGAKYVVIDDSHFKAAGLQEQDLYGYYLTEETGHVINIFPISEKLRYTIPFEEPEVTIEYLRSISSEEEDRLVVFADDGEKFGIWPNTYKHCYEDGWLERFFSTLEQNLDWIEIVHFSEALDKLLPKGRVYLPTASYREMMEWALPSDTILRYENFEHRLKDLKLFDNYKVFVRGGFWRNFLAKYEESNNLHKKSLRVSRKVRALKNNKKFDQQLVDEAQDYLWAGQTNCPYWHGIFGGLYLNNLRNAVYKNMIQAESLIDNISKPKTVYEKGWIDIEIADFDADGIDEVIAETKFYNFYFSPHSGAKLFEMDYKPKAVNLLDTMTRRKEAYHDRLIKLKDRNSSQEDTETKSIHDIVSMKEPGLENKLKYDWYRRSSLIDHFLAPETELNDFANCEYKELGDFVNSHYQTEIKENKNKSSIVFSRKGKTNWNDKSAEILLTKKIQIFKSKPDVEIYYEIRNLENRPVEFWFGIEFNFALLAGNAPDRYYYFDREIEGDKNLASSGEIKDVKTMGLKDEWMKIDVRLSFENATTVWRFPIETISQSEGGFERVYQSSVVFPNWKIKLNKEEIWETVIKQKIIDL